MQPKLRAADFFAGIGGIRLGFQQTFGDDLEFVYSNEIDKYACQTYQANFQQDPKGDITQLTPKNLPDFDLLLAGFPCQPFSLAGLQRGIDDPRGLHFLHIIRILEVKQPQIVVLENVKSLLNRKNSNIFTQIRSFLFRVGYTIQYCILNAAQFGVPQKRERMYLVGFRNCSIADRFTFPLPIHTHSKVRDCLEDQIDSKYYLSDRYLTSLWEHKKRHLAKGHGFGYQILDPDGIANTLVCGGMGHERNLIQDQNGIRKMTPREWARLQGFPDSFFFPVSNSQAYKQLGNSVAVPVIKAIANQIKKALGDQ